MVSFFEQQMVFGLFNTPQCVSTALWKLVIKQENYTFFGAPFLSLRVPSVTASITHRATSNILLYSSFKLFYKFYKFTPFLQMNSSCSGIYCSFFKTWRLQIDSLSSAAEYHKKLSPLSKVLLWRKGNLNQSLRNNVVCTYTSIAALSVLTYYEVGIRKTATDK